MTKLQPHELVKRWRERADALHEQGKLYHSFADELEASLAAEAKGADTPVLYRCKASPHCLVPRRCPGCDDRLTCTPCVLGQVGA